MWMKSYAVDTLKEVQLYCWFFIICFYFFCMCRPALHEPSRQEVRIELSEDLTRSMSGPDSPLFILQWFYSSELQSIPQLNFLLALVSVGKRITQCHYTYEVTWNTFIRLLSLMARLQGWGNVIPQSSVAELCVCDGGIQFSNTGSWVLLSYLHEILSYKSIKWNDTEMVDIPGPVSPLLIALVSRYVCNDIREIT